MSDGGLRRITVDQVREAAAKTGFEIKPDITLCPGERCGCPLGIVAYSIDPDAFERKGEDYIGLVVAAEVLGAHFKYADGFAAGFDGDEFKCDHLDTEDAEYARLGHEDGSACRRAFVEGAAS